MFSLFFFFSSRRRHTRLQGDWSSDVCSSDLHHATDDRRIVHAVPDPSRTHRQGLPRSRAVAPEEPHMSRRSMIWLAVAVVFTLVNLGGGVAAIAAGEAAHTALHAVLLLVGVAWVWRLAASRSASRDASR